MIASGRHPTIVLATTNEGKWREFDVALSGLGITLIRLDPSEDGAPDETASTYVGNATIKAVHAATRTGFPALADDSGLEVDALGGAPGVTSARYGGPGLDDAGRTAHLLAALGDVPDPLRTASFVCALVLARRDGTCIGFEGRCHGTIEREPGGPGGFGYDPVFRSNDLGTTFGRASAAAKARVSHRAAATSAFADWWRTSGAAWIAGGEGNVDAPH